MGLFFNVRKPRGYNPTPIFHNPEKEALEERILKKKKEMGMLEEGEYVSNVKGAFTNASSHVRRRKSNPEKSSTNTNVKLAVVLIVLILVFYWFYFR